MEENNIDDLFKEKIDQNNGFPENVKWNTKFGWDEYQRNFGEPKNLSKRIVVYATSAAAVFILFFLILKFNGTSHELISIVNNSVIPEEVKLPYGNIIWLNNKSSIEFSEKTDINEYHITINGEAYVEIKNQKSKTYIIKSQNAIVKVNNPATFNIRGYIEESSIDVTVSSGAVKVLEKNHDDGLALLVTKGNYCSVHRSQMLVYATVNNNQNYLAWKTGKFIFDNTPIETVTDILAEYYHTEIELENNSIAYCEFSGTFEVQDLDLILNHIKSDLNLKIINAGKKIKISGKGCL